MNTLRPKVRWLGWLLLAGLIVYGAALGAQSVQLRVLPLDVDSAELRGELGWPAPEYADVALLRTALAEWVASMRQQAYWEASVDSLVAMPPQYTALLHRGPRYEWDQLLISSDIPTAWLSAAGLRPRHFRASRLEYEDWLRLRDDLLLAAGERGYPFSQVWLDSLHWKRAGALSATLRLDQGSRVYLEQLKIPEEARIRSRYLEQYTGLTSGAPYNERRVRQLRDRLAELPFLRLTGEPTVTFRDDQATVHLPLTRQRAGRFDFLIGVLPNSPQIGGLLITGRLDGELYNSLGRGEYLAVRFEQLRPQTQELALAFNYPYLLDMPLGLDLQGSLYRRDTQFIDLRWRAGASYLWSGGNNLEVFWEQRQTNLLGFDRARVLREQQLPDTLDISRSSFGLAWQSRQLDYRYSPRRGWAVQLTASAGRKRIRRNNQLLAIGVGALYDSLNERSNQYSIQGQWESYVPLWSSMVLRFSLDGGTLIGSGPIVANEQFRLGGARQLRGFDEQSIFTTHFLIATLEYRLLLTRNSFLYTFVDAAYLDRRRLQLTGQRTDWPLGLGAGITFDTRAGLLSLSLAVGRQQQQPIDLGAPKVHVGYISLF